LTNNKCRSRMCPSEMRESMPLGHAIKGEEFK
jgi:hypothetical protein